MLPRGLLLGVFLDLEAFDPPALVAINLRRGRDRCVRGRGGRAGRQAGT